MGTKRMPPERPGLICAEIHGAAARHTRTGDPQGTARDAAIAELRDAATYQGKLWADLLSQQAGLFTGLAEGYRLDAGNEVGEWQRAQASWMAALCTEAAGGELVERLVAEWTAIGRERASRRRH